MVPTEGEQRQVLFTNLLSALSNPVGERQASHGTFAASKAIRPSEGFVLNSIHIEGASELRIPLSVEDIRKLRGVCEQAPGRCWQVDASKVSFPGATDFLLNSIQPLAMQAVRALGLNGPEVQLEAHLHKLVLFEKGGHFTFHRDNE